MYAVISDRIESSNEQFTGRIVGVLDSNVRLVHFVENVSEKNVQVQLMYANI